MTLFYQGRLVWDWGRSPIFNGLKVDDFFELSGYIYRRQSCWYVWYV